MVLRLCYTSDLKFRTSFLFISEIEQQNKFFAKILKNEKQIDMDRLCKICIPDLGFID